MYSCQQYLEFMPTTLLNWNFLLSLCQDHVGHPQGLLRGMDSTVKIILDNYANSVCYPGQTLSGRVECCFNEEKTVRAIRIKFKGKAKTKWTSGSGKHRKTHSAIENYFCDEYNLISGEDEIRLHAGRHTYLFSYTLPQSLPSSFEGRYGKVCYSIMATVDLPWKLDYQEKFVLNVVAPLDLDCLPVVRKPIAISEDKEVSSGCCRTELLTFNMSLPATEFAVGQQLDIGAFVCNMSNVTVESVQFRIMKVTEFIAIGLLGNHQKYEENLLTHCVAGAIGAHAEKAWTSSLTIPSINFVNLIRCSIINITYRVEAEVVLPFPHFNLRTKCPITIGPVPLTGVNMGLLGPPPEMSSYPSNSNATAPPVEGSTSISASGYNSNTVSPLGTAPRAVEDEFVLPSYEETRN